MIRRSGWAVPAALNPDALRLGEQAEGERKKDVSLRQWLLYVSVVLAVIVAPGPSAILCVSHGATHGALKTFATILGGMGASLTLMLASALGLGAAVAASDTLFHAIRLLGAAYLVYLGVSTWRAAPAAFGQPLSCEVVPQASTSGGRIARSAARALLSALATQKTCCSSVCCSRNSSTRVGPSRYSWRFLPLAGLSWTASSCPCTPNAARALPRGSRAAAQAGSSIATPVVRLLPRGGVLAIVNR